MNHADEFIVERTAINPGGYVGHRALCAAWRRWCTDRGRTTPVAQLVRELRALGYHTEPSGHSGRVWIGLSVTTTR